MRVPVLSSSESSLSPRYRYLTEGTTEKEITTKIVSRKAILTRALKKAAHIVPVANLSDLEAVMAQWKHAPAAALQQPLHAPLLIASTR